MARGSTTPFFRGLKINPDDESGDDKRDELTSK